MFNEDDGDALRRTLARLVHLQHVVGAPEDSALSWYVQHYQIRLAALARRSVPLFNVGEAIWDDDWVLNVLCALEAQGVDPRASIVVLVCADPYDYSRVSPDETVLQWLGASSGDILHFVWMVDRHRRPALETKLSIIRALASRGIVVSPKAMLLLVVALRSDAGGVRCDLEATVPVFGDLDPDAAKRVFSVITHAVRDGRAAGHDIETISEAIVRNVAAVRAWDTTTAAIEKFRKAVNIFFGG